MPLIERGTQYINQYTDFWVSFRAITLNGSGVDMIAPNMSSWRYVMASSTSHTGSSILTKFTEKSGVYGTWAGHWNLSTGSERRVDVRVTKAEIGSGYGTYFCNLYLMDTSGAIATHLTKYITVMPGIHPGV